MTPPLSTPKPLPRELVDGIFWMGGCLSVEYNGRPLHGYNSVYLVAGDDCSAIVEAGHPQDVEEVNAQLDELVARGVPEVRYIFITHTESPHSAGLSRMLDRFPNAVACGDTLDLHLVFPEHADRFMPLAQGESIDLGGTELVAVEAVIRDMLHTRWAFDTRRRVLFPGDGFAYSHYHLDGHCGCTAEEAPSLELPDMTALFATLALYWTRYSDMEPYIERLDEVMFDELDIALIAPSHGLPITDLQGTLPEIREGLRLGSQMST